MSLTVNSKPSGFRPVGGGELLYVFTESSLVGKTNYRVEITLSGLSSSIPVIEVHPDANGVVEVDIAPLLRSVLAMTEDPTDRIVSTYVIYQAVWDESSNAAVSLTGDVIYAYVGTNHLLNSRSQFYIDPSNSGPFLIPSDKLYVWANRTAYIEFMYSGLSSSTKVKFYPASGGSTTLDTSNLSGKGLKSVSYSAWTESGTIKVESSTGTVYSTIPVELMEECDNPVYLRWINDTGGLSTWLFSHNQIYQLSPQLKWRELNKLLVVDVVPMDVWLMLQDMNKDGAVYGDNKMLGMFMQDFTTESSPVDVIPNPADRQTETRYLNHQFELSVKYPRIPNNRI